MEHVKYVWGESKEIEKQYEGLWAKSWVNGDPYVGEQWSIRKYLG